MSSFWPKSESGPRWKTLEHADNNFWCQHRLVFRVSQSMLLPACQSILFGGTEIPEKSLNNRKVTKQSDSDLQCRYFSKFDPSYQPISSILGTPLVRDHSRTFAEKHQDSDKNSSQNGKGKNQISTILGNRNPGAY